MIETTETRITRTGPAGTIAPLRIAADAARGFAAASRSKNTIRAYRADWRDFEGWTRAHGLVALPAVQETVAAYLAALATDRKVSTIRRRLAAIGEAHKAAGFEAPGGSAVVRAVVSGIRRELGSAQTRKAPAAVEEIRRMVATLRDGLPGVRDRALLLLGFAGAFRRSELVALEVEDLTLSAEGITVSIRRSKTDQTGEGETVAIPYGVNVATCPVRAYLAWLTAAGISTGAIFRAVDRYGRISSSALSSDAVADLVKTAASRAGLDPVVFSGHSLRAGFATAAARAEVPEWRIMRQTRHKSRAILDRYIREANLFRGNAAGSVGL